MLAGNDSWRSPEAHFRGELNKPTDIFSFGIVVSTSNLLETALTNLPRQCIYAMLGRVIFDPDDDFHKHHAQQVLPALIRLQRQVSYFGDQETVNGLLKHIADDNTNCQVLRMLWEDRSEAQIPYKPFSQWWDGGDTMFKDFIRSLTNLDPAKRASAHEALEHPWLSDL
jgi:serine/threonine protein kinase